MKKVIAWFLMFSATITVNLLIFMVCLYLIGHLKLGYWCLIPAIIIMWIVSIPYASKYEQKDEK